MSRFTFASTRVSGVGFLVAVLVAGWLVTVTGAQMAHAAVVQSWSAALNLSANGGDSYTPQVVVSADGTTATAVWYRYDGFHNIVQSASATIAGNTATWGAVTDLSATGVDAFSPQVGVSADGTKATAIWYRTDGVQSKSATISGTTATWGAVTNLSATGQSDTSPQVGVSADGTTATAIWHRYDGSNYIVQSASATITGTTATWGTVTDLSASGRSAEQPQLGVSADGTKVTAIWLRYDANYNYIAQSASATITGSTATWGTVTGLSADTQDGDQPQVGVSADGTKATATWIRYDGSNYIVQSASATITGTTATWGTVTDLSASGRDASGPQVGVSADGTTATAVWTRDDGTNIIAQSASAAITGTTANWETATDVSAFGQKVGQPQVGVSADGTKATAVWRRFERALSVVQSASATISLPPGTPPAPTATAGNAQATVTVSAGSGGTPDSYTVTASPGGNTCTVNAAAGSCTVSGLTNGTAYAFTATATNISGTSNASPPSNQVTPTSGGGKAQTVANGCVTAGNARSIPAAGTRRLMKPDCRTNADQIIGIRVDRATPRQTTRGDQRYYTLYCQVSKKKTTTTRTTGYGNKSRYCAKGALQIRTHGLHLRLQITWSAPAIGGYTAYTKTKTYRT